MRVVVTGAAGYVGSTLTGLLAAQGHEVVAIDSDHQRLARLARSVSRWDTVALHGCSVPEVIRDPVVLAGAVAVIHLAGVSSDSAAETAPALTWQINVEASVGLAHVAKALGVARFLFASTAAVCQVLTGRRLEEEGSTNGQHGTAAALPVGTYARSKLAAEQALKRLADDHFSVVVLRKGSLYGFSPVMRWDLVINRMVLAAWAGRPFQLHDGGRVSRPIAHVQDAALAYLHLLQLGRSSDRPLTFNVVERNVRLFDALVAIDRVARRQLGRGVVWQHGVSPFPQRTGRVGGRALREIGWFPTRRLSDGSAELLRRLAEGEDLEHHAVAVAGVSEARLRVVP